MVSSSKTRRVGIWALGLGAVLVLLLFVTYRKELWSVYLAFQWSRIDVVLLDNCDPNYKGPGPHGDSVRFLSSSGKEISRVEGLNNCESVGANHTIALDPARFRLFVTEVVGGRVTALDPRGETLFSIEETGFDALAVDPGTGNLWALTGDLSSSGATVVFNADGHRLASHVAQGFDLCYNPFDKSFWVVGDRVYKLDGNGEVLFEKHQVGWAKVSVAPDPRDGSVWVVERNRGVGDRILRLHSSGEIAQEFQASGSLGVACDPETGIAWTVARGSVLRFSPDGKRLAPLPHAALGISIGPRTGHIWVATKSGALRLTSEGRVAAEYRLPSPSSQCWIAAR